MFASIYAPNGASDTHAALLICASAFSPRIEDTSADTVVFDVEGLERLCGSYEEIAAKIFDEVRQRGIEAHVAIAANPDAAVCAARGFAGITVLPRGTEGRRLRDLSMEVLSPSLEILETLERWGIRTFGAFAKLPAAEVSARLGQEGVRLHNLARGMRSRPLRPYAEAVRFVEVMELDYEIHTIEPLTFILSRLLDQLCSRLRTRNLATHEVHLELNEYTRVLNLPLPVRNPKILTKLLILDLEARPPGIPVSRVRVEGIPAKPRVVQNGLFVPLSPEPEKLELTLARISGVVGEGNVGAVEILDTYRPDAFRVTKFGLANNSPPDSGGVAAPSKKYSRSNSAQTGWSLNDHPGASLEAAPYRACATRRHPFFPRREISLGLRYFRPPLDATVQTRNEIPTWIAFHGVHGPISTASGPWRTSGDWWRPNTWDRESWDIETCDTLYRIYFDVHLGRWFAEGVYD